MNDIILIADKRGNPVGGIKANKATLQANARSILADRLSLGSHGTQFGGDRDYYSVLGYNAEPDYEDYRAKFERDPLAGTIVEYPCSETWRDTPTVKDGKDKDAKDDTEFCNAWSDFAERMKVYSFCRSVDILAGIGQFALLHIGVSGHGETTSEVRSMVNVNDIIYLTPYSQEAVSVHEWQTNPNNLRYGLPNSYKISVSHMTGTAANPFSTRELIVHWSRCIHVAEGLLENQVYGRPRLQRVVNLLDDVMKVVGGSAEATWLLIRKGLVLDVDPDARLTDPERENLHEQFDEYNHGIRRFLTTIGMKVTDLGSEVADPSGIFDVIITLISVATRIPKRILLGSERGELASSQDASNWAGHIASRQLTYAEPVILRPLIDRLLKWGAIPKPEAGRYTCVWDALFELNDTEKAANAKVWAEALEKASAAFGYPAMTLEEFRGEFTPLPGKLPPEIKKARDEAKKAREIAAVPPGKDVLEQVGELDAVKALVANHGYNERDARMIVQTAAKLIHANGAVKAEA